MSENYMIEYEKWLNHKNISSALKAELESIEGNNKEIEERFYTELSFGTAGLRGIIGAGTNRMNVHVVRRATTGVAKYLKMQNGAAARGVAIAYDSRNMSKEFARQTAIVLAEIGIKAYLYKTLHSVPQLSFTIRHLGCAAGIVITASHNPPQYNGYKVYWEDGGQVAPEQADNILKYINTADYFGEDVLSFDNAVKKGLITLIGEEVDEAYYKATQSLLLHPQLVEKNGKKLRMVYTPLHGSGCVPVSAILNRIGISNVSIVKEQEAPNGNFPTVKAPNPEDPDAFTLAVNLANKVGATVILATDPDSDRLGVDVRRADGSFCLLTGNQIGCILLHYILTSLANENKLPSNGLVVRSVVSTSMADAICAHYNVRIDHVPTGFRFISAKIAECERTHKNTFLFGFEESFGFLRGSFSRDKDAICAAMLVAEACVYYKEQGKTLYDVLCDMYEIYGYYMESVKSYTLAGKVGMEKIAGAMRRLRNAPPREFAGIDVVYAEDMMAGERLDMSNGEKKTIDMRGFDILRYGLKNGAWLCVRPSGTEPKLKLYIGANSKNETETNEMLKQLLNDADKKISVLLG